MRLLKGVGLAAELDILAFGRATRTGPTHAPAAPDDLPAATAMSA